MSSNSLSAPIAFEELVRSWARSCRSFNVFLNIDAEERFSD